MEARGVTVAWQIREFLILGESSSSTVTAATRITVAVIGIRRRLTC